MIQSHFKIVEWWTDFLFWKLLATWPSALNPQILPSTDLRGPPSMDWLTSLAPCSLLSAVGLSIMDDLDPFRKKLHMHNLA